MCYIEKIGDSIMEKFHHTLMVTLRSIMVFMYILDRFQNSSKCFKKRLFDLCLS